LQEDEPTVGMGTGRLSFLGERATQPDLD
jgi:hypothetical protein